MALIYITGDTHRDLDIDKIKRFDDSTLTKEDYLIICGDAGFVWHGTNEDDYLCEWLEQRNFTTLFVDGNHENHNALDTMPIELWNGGKIHKINSSAFHLMRGQVFTIDGKQIFTMGGATSTDKHYREENVSWWAREMPSKDEYEEALSNLEANKWNVDFVITHTAPDSIVHDLCAWYEKDELTQFLSMIDGKLEYKHWFFGHFHDDRVIDNKHTMLYEDIIRIKIC